MDDPTKAVMEVEETGRERLTIRYGMARLPILEEFVIDLGPAFRVCRPAQAIKECLESMHKRISVMQEAVSAPLPTSSSPPSPGPSSGPPVEQGASIPPRGGLYLSGCSLAAMEAPIV